MICQEVIYRQHAILRMVARRVRRPEVEAILLTGYIITEYPTDKPFPSCLLLGFINERPLHVVAAQNEDGRCFVITVYEPDPAVWNDDFTIKKKL